jgi:hypothetical protein
VPCGKQLAKHLLQEGIQLRSLDLCAITPAREVGVPGEVHQKLDDMDTEALAAAATALTELRVPSAVLKPFRDILVARTIAEEQQSSNNARMLEQVHCLMHRKAKQRDLARAVLQSLQEQLEAQGKVLEGLEHDVDSLQQQARKLLAATTGHTLATKRPGELAPERARLLDFLGKGG